MGDVSEGALGGMTGLIGVQAGLLEFFGFEFQIGAEFAFQVVLAMLFWRQLISVFSGVVLVEISDPRWAAGG